MSNPVQESYIPLPITASGVIVSGPGATGGFLCTTAGTLKLSYGADGSGATIVDTFSVAAGQFTPLPFSYPPNTIVYATLAGGAKGTFAVL